VEIIQIQPLVIHTLCHNVLIMLTLLYHHVLMLNKLTQLVIANVQEIMPNIQEINTKHQLHMDTIQLMILNKI